MMAFFEQMLNCRWERFSVLPFVRHELRQKLIEKYSTIISPSIPTIEKLGGGSAHCMMAEIFLPRG